MPKVESAQLRTRLLTEYVDFTEIDGELQCKFCATKVSEFYALKCLEVLIHDIALFFGKIFSHDTSNTNIPWPLKIFLIFI